MELPIASPMLQIALDVMVMDRHDPLNSWPQAVEEEHDESGVADGAISSGKSDASGGGIRHGAVRDAGQRTVRRSGWVDGPANGVGRAGYRWRVE